MVFPWLRRTPGQIALVTALVLFQLAGVQVNRAAAQLNHPFEGQNVVYVFHEGQWREAFIQEVSGRMLREATQWSYSVRYLDELGGAATGILPEQMRTIAEAQAQQLTDNVYDLTTEAGIEQMLAAHNRARQAVGVDDLGWSPSLAASAQSWADVLIAENRFEHSSLSLRAGGAIGENLAFRGSSIDGGSFSTPLRAVQGWLNEQVDYDYTSNSCTANKMCGHYTQMVWEETTEVGCAVARNDTARQEIWVCHYWPAGNVVGQRPY